MANVTAAVRSLIATLQFLYIFIQLCPTLSNFIQFPKPCVGSVFAFWSSVVHQTDHPEPCYNCISLRKLQMGGVVALTQTRTLSAKGHVQIYVCVLCPICIWIAFAILSFHQKLFFWEQIVQSSKSRWFSYTLDIELILMLLAWHRSGLMTRPATHLSALSRCVSNPQPPRHGEVFAEVRAAWWFLGWFLAKVESLWNVQIFFWLKTLAGLAQK